VHPQNVTQQETPQDLALSLPPSDREVSRQSAGNSASTVADASGKGPISQLQEFVQSSKQFPLPPHRPILQWEFETRMVDSMSLEFRATAAFLLDGVPHHVAGEWLSSKKHAQRDSAERALVFFVGDWGRHFAREDRIENQAWCPAFDGESSDGDFVDHVSTLDEFSKTLQGPSDAAPNWMVSWEGDMCRAHVEFDIMGVPHKFPGVLCESEEDAMSDSAHLILWYLQCPGYEDDFEPDLNSEVMSASKIPVPPQNWVSGGSETGALQVAERKTLLMRVQNRLQQMFAKQLESGTSAWDWKYDSDTTQAGWSQMCRATVRIQVNGLEFTGGWHLSQREAQIDACQRLSDYLDVESQALEEGRAR